jgi:ATP/maltotriose-dependent transcriptional regulator MalT
VAIEAKYLRPRLDHITLRPEARDALAAAFERRLAIVCAPAGYGKTTTTAAALDLCGRSVAWYKLDILDHDPLAFLAALTRAVQRLHPGFGATLLRELESGPVLDVPPQALAARFCSECDRVLTAPDHLVLDDYHEAMDAPAMNEVLGYLLENCPETVHFVILTRYEPIFRLEKLRLAGEVARVPRDVLLFNARQVAEVLQQRSGQQHDPEHVGRLHALTEGWPASVVLAGMALAWLDAASLEDALSDPRLRGDVFSYLAEQVFQRQSDDVQRFLLRTCCLEHVNAPLAERLTGERAASRHLNFLARNHVFTFDTGRQGTYRYHNLLRDFLRQRFVQDEGERSFRALQCQTATALEACGDRPGAVELLLSANEPELALGVIARGGEAELERRPSEQLRLWVSRLAPSAEAGDAWALVVSAVLDAREGRFSAALAALAAGSETLRRDGDVDGLYEVLSITEWAQFWSGDSAASIATCNSALAVASTNAQRLHTLLSLMSAALDMRRWGTVSSASQEADALLRHARPDEAARAQALRAHAAFYQGEMYVARDLIAGCQERTQTVAQRATYLNTQGMIDMALGDFSSAARNLAKASTIAEGFGDALTTHIEDNLAFLALCVGEFDDALHRLFWLQERSCALDPTMLCSVLMHRGTAMRRSGDVHSGLEPTQLAIETVGPDRDPYLAFNARANLALTQGLLGAERRSALKHLSSAAAAAGVSFVELKTLLFEAVLAFGEGEPSGAIELLELCLPRQLTLGHINLIAQELCPRPELTSLVLRRHKSNGLGPALVEALSHHWRFSEVGPTLVELCPSQVKTWVDHVVTVRGPAKTTERTAGRRDRPIEPTQSAAKTSALDTLTPREHEVLQLMAQDRSNMEIAGDLFISIPTVKTHVNHILRKLGQKKRVGAILEYQRLMGRADDRQAAAGHVASPPTLEARNPPWV